MGIKIERIVLRHIRLPLVHFFETSFGRTYERDIVLVEVTCDGISGWGEVTAGENPFYNEEWTGSVWPLLIDYVAPRVLHQRSKAHAKSAREQRIFAATTWRAEASRRLFGTSRRGLRKEPLWKTLSVRSAN